jgi:hypothetical protein
LARNLPTDWISTAVTALGELDELDGAGATVRRWDSEGRTAWRVG